MKRSSWFHVLSFWGCPAGNSAYADCYAKAVAGVPGLSPPHEGKCFHPEFCVAELLANAGGLLVVWEAASDGWFGAAMVQIQMVVLLYEWVVDTASCGPCQW